MTKLDFLITLHQKLSALPKEEVDERLNFYAEMIEDRMEEGLSEEEAVAAVGSVDDIAAQILNEYPSFKPTAEIRKPSKPLKAWQIALLALGTPVGIPVLLGAISALLSLYVSVWAVIITLWAVFGSMVACGFGGVIGGIVLVFVDYGLASGAMIAAGIVCAGLAIFLFFGCRAVTDGVIWLTKKLFNAIRGFFVSKEVAK